MKKIISVGAAVAVLALTLTGCTIPVSTDEPVDVAPVTETDESTVETSESSDAPSTSADGWTLITFTGMGLEKGDNGEYPKYPVEIEAAVTSIEPVSESERAAVIEVSNESSKATIDAFDMWKVVVSERYVSGDDPAHQASYTSYKAVNSENVPLNAISVIGFDWCDSSAFSSDFISGEINSSCVLALVPKGGEAPAGVQFSQYDTDSADNPVLILKK